MTIVPQKPTDMISPEATLPGRPVALSTAETHFLSGLPLKSDIPAGFAEAMFGMGCFWGVERMFWNLPGVWLTMVGYAGGQTLNPTYEEVCTGLTNHNEVVRVIFDPSVISYEGLLRHFWENHDPTQGMRQGGDRGTQYRSGIYTCDDAQAQAARDSLAVYQARLAEAGRGTITTEIEPVPTFFFAEDYHQQYLAKNPQGYCGLGGTGVTCPIGLGV